MYRESLMDDNEGDGPIRWTGGSQPYITHPKDVGAVTPGPIVGLLQVTPLDLAPICQLEDIGAFPFHQEGAPVRGGHTAHELRIAKPTIGHDDRWRQVHTAPAQGRYAPIQH